MKWRKPVRILHRDIGYIAVGLTIIYSVSGIAVNHVADWNPNYIIENSVQEIEPYLDSAKTTESMVEYVANSVGLNHNPKNIFRSGPNSVDLFYEGKTVSADLNKGAINIETVTSRGVFRETNFLHLNAPKKLWTYVADLFAVSLILLAITGMFMIKGKNGITGRGKWLTIAGFLIPIIFLIIYFWLFLVILILTQIYFTI